MKEKLIIVTGNSLKFEELSLELSKLFLCEQGVLPDYFEIQGTPEEIINHKLKAAYSYFKEPVLVDDTSLHFEELGGFPGPYIKDFIKHLPVYKMGVKFAGTRVKVSCWLGYYDGVKEVIVNGTINGSVEMPEDIDVGPKEFDLFVKIDGTDKVMLHLTTEEKNEYSHRGYAIKNLIKELQK